MVKVENLMFFFLNHRDFGGCIKNILGSQSLTSIPVFFIMGLLMKHFIKTNLLKKSHGLGTNISPILPPSVILCQRISAPTFSNIGTLQPLGNRDLKIHIL